MSVPDCEPTTVAVAGVAAAAVATATDGTWSREGSGRSCRTGRNRNAVAVAAGAAGRRQPRPGDYSGDSDGTATYSGISGPNAAPSPITYHPCATTARSNVLVAYRFIYEATLAILFG